MSERSKILTSIWFLIALFLLLLNDFVLKETYHNWITGKLSDFAGLFIFPIFWTVIFPNKKKTVFIATGILFILWKSEFSQPYIDFFNALEFLSISRVVDYSDLIALLILPISYVYYDSKKYYFSIRLNPIIPFIISSFAFVATSEYKPEARIDYSTSYNIKTYSRDSLMHRLNNLGYNVLSTGYNDCDYDDEQTLIYHLNDTINSVFLSIKHFDSTQNKVHVVLESIQYNDSLLGSDDPAKLDPKIKIQLKSTVEKLIINKLKIDLP